VPIAPYVLPEGSVLLHVGPAKTGSTAVQHTMFQARDRLAAHGVHYVGSRPHEKEAGAVALGVRGPIGRRPARPEAWQRLVEEIAGATLPRLCLSNEDFGRADDDALMRILEATGPERTHLVYVARRLDKVLPSHWQQQVKARVTASYLEFLREVLAPAATSWRARLVMEPQDPGLVLARWGKHLPPERMIVVVAEEGNRAALPRAFEALLGLPDGLLKPAGGTANRSMGYAETEAVRRINRLAIDEEWTPHEYHQIVQRGVVQTLKKRDTAGPRLNGIPADAFDRVADLADAQVEAIRSSGARVIGDHERLRVRGQVQSVPLPSEVDAVNLDLLADIVSGVRAGSVHLSERRPNVDVRTQAENLGGRQLLQLIARRATRRLGTHRA
jgi:hypothetical protein